MSLSCIPLLNPVSLVVSPSTCSSAFRQRQECAQSHAPLVPVGPALCSSSTRKFLSSQVICCRVGWSAMIRSETLLLLLGPQLFYSQFLLFFPGGVLASHSLLYMFCCHCHLPPLQPVTFSCKMRVGVGRCFWVPFCSCPWWHRVNLWLLSLVQGYLLPVPNHRSWGRVSFSSYYAALQLIFFLVNPVSDSRAQNKREEKKRKRKRRVEKKTGEKRITG